MVRSRSSRASSRQPDDDPEVPTVETSGDGEGNWVVGLDCRSMNIYRFLRVRLPTAPRGVIRQWIDGERVLVNGQTVLDSRPLRAGDVVSVDANLHQLPKTRRRKKGPEVLFEDEAMIAIDKPAGLATVPERNPRHASLLESLKGERSDATIKLVHRLDKQASGVVVFAKGREAKRQLIDAFVQRKVTKDYLALVHGRFERSAQRIETRLAPVSGRTPRIVVRRDGGKSATTLARCAFRFRRHSVVHARPITGRTHQIRVHLQHLGHALLADPVYGRETELYLSGIKHGWRRARGEVERPLLARLALHAARIRLRSPTGADVDIRVPLPKDLAATIRQLHKASPTERDEDFERFMRSPLDPDGDELFAALGPEPDLTQDQSWEPEESDPEPEAP